MRAVDLIDKKRRGMSLTHEEQKALIDGYVKGEIPDYQMSAFLMAVVWRGMSAQELSNFTKLMSSSGDQLDLSAIPGVKVDKHSTGGVGDKTTLVLGPLLAAVGVPVAKMSGRGLGHTGGTIDKLESIPGLNTGLSTEAFIEQVKTVGVAVAGQTGDLAPADKRIYALRDVTATVQSIPLIASSIMSKKLASGADAIVLDVKVGDGAFMKTLDDAKRLARTMVRIGNHSGRRTVAVLSSMEQPLGHAIGNALEVREAIETLNNRGPADLTEVSLELGAQMAVLAGVATTPNEAKDMLTEVLKDGRGIAKFKAFVEAQGGDASIVDHPERLPIAPVIQTLNADHDGYVHALPALAIGEAAMRLGAGRQTKEDQIDPAVGLVIPVKIGQAVKKGDVLAEVHGRDEAAVSECLKALHDIVELADTAVDVPSLVLAHVAEDQGDADGLNSDRQVQSHELLESALQARERAYVPYSKFAVGAALLLSDGSVVTGGNIENASYGLTNCAERSAVFSAIGQVGQENLHIEQIAVVADAPEPVSPCGACRQVLAEFCRPETPVYLSNLKGDVLQTTVAGLLPGAFTTAQMVYVERDK